MQVDIFESLLPDDNSFKILHNNPQSYHDTDTMDTVMTEKRLKFGKNITADWMTNELNISDATEGDK